MFALVARYCDIFCWDSESVRFYETRIYQYRWYVHGTSLSYITADVHTMTTIIGAEKELNVNYIAIFSLITFFLPHLLKIGVRTKKTTPSLNKYQIVAFF